MFGLLIIVGIFWIIFSFLAFVDECVWNKKKIVLLCSIVGVIIMYFLMYLTFHWEVKERYNIVSVEEASTPLGQNKGKLRNIVKTTNGIFVIDPYYARYEFNGENILEVCKAKSLFMTTGDYKYIIKK